MLQHEPRRLRRPQGAQQRLLHPGVVGRIRQYQIEAARGRRAEKTDGVVPHHQHLPARLKGT
jgi:hypothetical protein